MNLKEKKEIAIGLTVLMDAIIDDEDNMVDVANSALSFAIDLLKRFPDIREIIESLYEDDWDKNIQWIKFEMEHLKTK